MIKIVHVRDNEVLRGVPSEVVNVIRDAVTILDTEYGEVKAGASEESKWDISCYFTGY